MGQNNPNQNPGSGQKSTSGQPGSREPMQQPGRTSQQPNTSRDDQQRKSNPGSGNPNRGYSDSTRKD